jgi:hypothetical protein
MIGGRLRLIQRVKEMQVPNRCPRRDVMTNGWAPLGLSSSHASRFLLDIRPYHSTIFASLPGYLEDDLGSKRVDEGQDYKIFQPYFRTAHTGALRVHDSLRLGGTCQRLH